jgi:hypothetical protein
MQLEGVAVLVRGIDPLAVVFSWIRMRMMMMLTGVVIGPMTHMGMVQVNPSHGVVVIRVPMHVGISGETTERQIQDGTSYCDEPAHLREYTGRPGHTPFNYRLQRFLEDLCIGAGAETRTRTPFRAGDLKC